MHRPAPCAASSFLCSVHDTSMWRAQLPAERCVERWLFSSASCIPMCSVQFSIQADSHRDVLSNVLSSISPLSPASCSAQLGNVPTSLKGKGNVPRSNVADKRKITRQHPVSCRLASSILLLSSAGSASCVLQLSSVRYDAAGARRCTRRKTKAAEGARRRLHRAQHANGGRK